MNRSSVILAVLPFLFRLVRRMSLPRRQNEWALNILHELHDIFSPQGTWRDFINSIDSHHFDFPDVLSADQKRRLFKSSVRLVDLEPHAYCNRQCPFCPNSFLDRQGGKGLMDMNTYRHVIGQLAEIHYDRAIRFSRYCEPLACSEIFDFISLARESLPDATIDIVTNGDYLNSGVLAKLADAGLSAMYISIYPKGYAWNDEAAHKQFVRICDAMEVDARQTYVDRQTICWSIPHPKIEISARASNLEFVGFDRGQSLTDLIDENYRRTSPCPFVFRNVTIDFDFSMMPCCNLRADMPEHRKFIVGNLNPHGSIFDLYCSKELSEWRWSLATVDAKRAPCNTCKQQTLKSRVSLAFLKAEISDKFRGIGRK